MTILDEAIQHIDHLLEDLSILLQEGSEAADTHEQLAPAVEPQTKAAKAVKAGKGSKPPAAGARPSDDFAKANLQVFMTPRSRCQPASSVTTVKQKLV